MQWKVYRFVSVSNRYRFAQLGVLLLGLIRKYGLRWRSRLRHRATSRKVEGSVLAGVIGIFH